MSFAEDLAVLSSDLVDDLDIGLGSEGEYQDSLPPAPVKAGNYVLKIVNLGASKNKAGEAVMTEKDGKKFPVLNYSAEIVEPVEVAGRRAVSFQSIFTVPFNRNGYTASALVDIIRAFDATQLPRTVGQQIETLKGLAETGTFRAAIDWEAYDADYFTSQVSAREADGTKLTKDQKNALRKEATVKGMRRFKQNPDGTYAPIVVHPKSGNTLEAKAVVTRYIPSSQEGVKVG
jgi:hypothetical protein